MSYSPAAPSAPADEQLPAEDVLAAQASPAGLAWLADGRNTGTDPDDGWLPYPHLTMLSDYLLQVVSGEIPKLIVTMPPRHGKSMLISQALPAWFLGRWPKKKVIIASATADLAYDFSREARNVLGEYGPQVFGTTLRDDSRAVQRWHTSEGGMLIAAGVGGQITGRGAHLLVIDDPIKGDDEAFSELIRNKHWKWWLSTARARLQNNAGVVLVLTRWHEDDLAGRLLQQMADNPAAGSWQVLNLPALAEDGDELGRAPGEPLCPDLIPLDQLEELKAGSSYYWSAMYQQRPAPEEGGIFRRGWWQTYAPYDWPKHPTGEAHAHQVVASWDMTFKEGTDSDYVVGQLWMRDQANKWLLAQVRARLNMPDTCRAVEALKRWADDQGLQPNHRIFIEQAANGQAVFDTLRKRIPGMVLVPAVGTKEARAHAASPQVESGNVFIPKNAIPCPEPLTGDDGRALWAQTPTELFVHEHAAFPAGMHDDQVDALTQALLHMDVRKRTGKSKVRVGGYDPGRLADR